MSVRVPRKTRTVATSSSTSSTSSAGRVSLPSEYMGLAKATLIFGVDPGLQGTGVAAFFHGSLIQAGVLSVPSAKRDTVWWERAAYLGRAFRDFVQSVQGFIIRDNTLWQLAKNELLIPAIVSEYPQHFGTAGSSMGFKTGDLVKLAHLVGLFQGLALGTFYPVEVNRWKGQLPKALVTERLIKKLGAKVCADAGVQSHAWDAVGIAMWAQGRF